MKAHTLVCVANAQRLANAMEEYVMGSKEHVHGPPANRARQAHRQAINNCLP